MLLTFVWIFAVAIGLIYLVMDRKHRTAVNARLLQALAVPQLTPHEQLMEKYRCSMTDEEIAELNGKEWR